MAIQTVNCVVVGLQNHPVAATAPTLAGQLLIWNGSSYQPGGVAVVIDGASITPHTNNTIQCGTTGAAWSQVNAYALNNLSDPRLKKDVQRVPSSLALVMSIPPKTFRFKTEAPDAPVHWGFLTTDVQEAMGKSFAGVQTGDDPDHTQTLAAHEMLAVLWRAVQELSDEVAELHDKSRTIRSAQSN